MAILLFLFPCLTSAQRVTGKVINTRNEPLSGANLYWSGSALGARSNTNGLFELQSPGPLPAKLVASYVGYQPDTVTIQQLPDTLLIFQLREKQGLSEIVVESQRSGIILADNNPIKVEQITQAELRKSACCDLAGCFETQTTVQPQTTNVVTNAKELRILGLSGVYNQILLDGFPVIQGLTYTYGISSIPGTVVGNIYVAKGANSVLQGFESISGQINVETKEPDKTDRLLLNGYVNSFGEKHVNLNHAIKKNKWSNLTALHMVQPAGKIDRDEDTFLDLPLLTRYQLLNKWKYGNEKNWGWSSRIGIRLLHERRMGGQEAFNPSTDKGSTSIYGQAVEIDQPEIWTKTGYRFNDKHHVTIFFSTFYQRQRSYFGTVRYRAQQSNAYLNLQYELTYQEHQLKSGISFRQLDLNEKIDFTDQFLLRTYDGSYTRTERIPGVFAENTMRLAKDKITWIVGIRGDRHNEFGFQVTPRTLIKYDITPKTILRANIGTGWRTVNLFSENIGLLVSARDILFTETLRPERALNMGINLTKKFQSASNKLSGHVSVDLYRTSFQNQIFPDYDSDPTKAIIQNFEGKSISNGLQTEVLVHLWNKLELKTGYNFLDVFRIIGTERQLLPFNPRQKLLTTISYRPANGPFQADMNIHWYGKQRLPDTKSNPTEFQRPDFSNPFTLFNVQLTYGFKKIELYGGAENLLDFRQRQPIISWQNPFSPFFDTSSVWGPTRGRELYVGFRVKLKEKKEPQ